MSPLSSARIHTTSALVLPTVYYLHRSNILKLYSGLDRTLLAAYQRHSFALNLFRIQSVNTTYYIIKHQIIKLKTRRLKAMFFMIIKVKIGKHGRKYKL